MLAAVIPEMTRPEKKPAERRRERHDDVIEAKPEVREKDHRSPAEPVRQHAKHRRKYELHEGKDRPENAKHFRRTRRIAAEKIEHQLRQDRRDQSERKHVQRHGDENENDGSFAGFHVIQSGHSLKTWTLSIHDMKRKRLIAGISALYSYCRSNFARSTSPRSSFSK